MADNNYTQGEDVSVLKMWREIEKDKYDKFKAELLEDAEKAKMFYFLCANIDVISGANFFWIRGCGVSLEEKITEARFLREKKLLDAQNNPQT